MIQRGVNKMNKKLAITSLIVIASCISVGIYLVTQIFRHFDDVIAYGMPLLADAMKVLIMLTSTCFGAAGLFALILGFALWKK